MVNLINLVFCLRSSQLFNLFPAHAFPVFFGGTKVSDDASYIVSVPSLHLVYFVTADTKRQDAKWVASFIHLWQVFNLNCFCVFSTYRGAAWEDQFLDTVGYYEDSGYFKHISIARFASRTLDHELEKNTRTVIPYFSSTFILMAIFRWVFLTLKWLFDSNLFT